VQSAAGVRASEARRLVSAVRAAYMDAKGWQVFDDVLPALARLRNHGWRHIVLSNHVPELPELVETLGLGALIAAVYCSACTGVEKPHRKAFETVFARYPEAQSGWMIGDSWRADVQGALAVGRRAILVRFEHPEATLQCKTLKAVVGVVENI